MSLTITIKKQHIPFYILFTIFWIFSVFNYANTDYKNYQLIYDSYARTGAVNNGIVEVGFYVLCLLGNRMGITFPVFRVIYITVALLFLFEGIRYFSQDNVLPVVLYFLFPFTLDIVQFRFLMASAISVFSCRFLVEKKVKLYIFFILLATTQHLVAIFYLIFLLALLSYNKIEKYILIIGFTEFSIVFFLPRLLSQLGGELLPHYVSYQSSSYSLRLCILYMVMTICFIIYDDLLIRKYEYDNKAEFLRSIVLLSVLVIPFIALNENFARLYRGIIILIYAALLDYNSSVKSDARKLVPIIFCLVMFYIHLSPHSTTNWYGAMLPMLKHNYFFDLFKR